MADPFGKDMDNLRKHMGGGGGGGGSRRQKTKEEQKPKFTYVQEREVFVCQNGAPKSEGTVIRCGVHDLRSVEELKARIADLLYFGTAPVTKVWMDDGVPVHAVNLLRDRDILFASVVPDEPFYGDTPKPQAPATPDPHVPAPASAEAKPPSLPEDTKASAQGAKPRPFYQPQLEGGADSEAGRKEVPTSLLSKYGGEEHFLITDMLVSKPRSIPMSLRPPEEHEVKKVPEDPIDACIKQKRKALSHSSTASALLALLQQTAAAQPLEDDLAQLAKPMDPGPAKPVGLVGGAVAADPAPTVQLTKKQQEQLRRQQLKKRAKKKQAKQKKQEEQSAADLAETSESDLESESDPAAKTRRLDPNVRGAAPPPKLPDRPYVVLPSAVIDGVSVYDPRNLVRGETVPAREPKAPPPKAGSCSPTLSATPQRTTQMEPPPTRPAAAFVLQAHAAGPRPPANPTENSSDSEEDDAEGLGPRPPAAAALGSAGEEGRGEGMALQTPRISPGPGHTRPSAAYVLHERDVGPRRPPSGTTDDSSDDEDELGPRPPL
eukprot:GGOE01062088.1.p1 GENE.GGOE01062088.1~~GGOE01062088.1.p1  ORF type:complete len:547 (+),score=122.01 GGOE01062088.1:95-1735(+)